MFNRNQVLLSLLIFMTALGLAASTLLSARATSTNLSPYQPETTPQASPQNQAAWQVVRVHFKDRTALNRLAARLEPWEVNHAQGYALVGVTPAELAWLEANGFQVEIDEKLTARLNQPPQRLPGQASGIPGFPCYRTVEETYAAAQNIAQAYPHLASWLDIGDSWEKIMPGGEPGYDLKLLRLTNSLKAGPKPKLFVMSSIHAREYSPAELNTRFAEYLVANYGQDPDVTWLLDYHEIHLLWRKNKDNNYCGDTNFRGADLNRNFDFQWGCCQGSSGYVCDQTYRGPSPASEPETRAIQNYLRSQFADLRPEALDVAAPVTATGVFLDLHSYSNLVLWPWGFITTPPPNETALQTLGRKLAYFNNYAPSQAIDLYPSDGTTDDFAYGELGLAAFTFELGSQFFQDCTTFEKQILPDNLESLLYAARVARAPYQLPAGPDVAAISVSPVSGNPGAVLSLEANLDDTRFNASNGPEATQIISAAEFYLDAPPWVTAAITTPHPLSALDGSYDASVETVFGEIDTTGLSHGRHTIFVRGQDAAGNWGPVSARFFYVLDPAVAPRIEGFVSEQVSGAPLVAQVTAGDFSAASNGGGHD